MQQSSESLSRPSQSRKRARHTLHETSDDNTSDQPLYSPISNNSIRLLEITGTALAPAEPGTTFRDLAICCSLQTATLDQVTSGNVSFTALSYVWGSTEPKRYIICNGHLKSVTPNLYDALWELARGRYEVPRLLWIDAICINQDDNEERSSQVQLMCNIYSQAELVLVWLGNQHAVKDKQLELFWSALDSDAPVRSIDAARSDDNSKLAEVTTESWFTRMWTFQEICLAKRACLLCNRMVICWDRFASAMAQSGVITAIENTRRAMSTGQFLLVDALLRLTRSREAEDSRDLLYGVLGLYRGAKLLTADYGKSDLEVRAMVLRHLAQESLLPNKHVFLPFYHRAGTFDCAQSWVPSWDWLRAERESYTEEYSFTEEYHPQWHRLHSTYVQSIQQQDIPGTNIQVRGVLCAVNISLRNDDMDGSLPGCSNASSCIFSAVEFRRASWNRVETTGPGFGNNDMAPKWYDPSEICELMYDHRRRYCKYICKDYEVSAWHMDEVSSEGMMKEVGWNCHIFGAEFPMILKPYFDSQRRKVLFAVVRTMLPTVNWSFDDHMTLGNRAWDLYAPMTFELIGDPSGLVFQDLDTLYEAVKRDRQR